MEETQGKVKPATFDVSGMDRVAFVLQPDGTSKVCSLDDKGNVIETREPTLGTDNGLD